MIRKNQGAIAKKAAPASSFSDHERKGVIRKYWCKPQLKMLSDGLKKKLIYIGLPDIEALDVLEWIDYLDKVIAFQCSEYIPGVKIDVSKLVSLLEDLERQNKIKSGFVYEGFIEDILMGGMSKNGGQTYSQNDFMKVYNLDFCSNLKYPRKIVNAKGQIIESIHKTEVIDRLLEFQRNIKKYFPHTNITHAH